MNGYINVFTAVILAVMLTISLASCGISKGEEETTAPEPDQIDHSEAETKDYAYYDLTAIYEEEMTAPETTVVKKILNKAPATTAAEEETTVKQTTTVEETVRTEAETTTVKPTEATAPTTTRPVETTPPVTTTKPAETTTKSSIDIGSSDPRTKITFSTTDINGNPVSSNDYSGAGLIMINYWEPWCGPCVSEMPSLSRLYDEYRDQGLVILGVFSENNLEDAKEVVQNNSISYPVLISNSDIKPFKVSAIPTTVFLDGEGHVISPEPYVGSRNYNSWKAIIDENFAKVR